MRPRDDIDMAGFAYLITEYDSLIDLMDHLPDHDEKKRAAQAKLRTLSAHWLTFRGFTYHVDAVADARHYRHEHPAETQAYLARSAYG